MLCEQIMNEWFALKKGYYVNLFGIVDEGVGEIGLQYNYIYGEETKHGANQVTSMLNHFFTTTCPCIVSTKILHLHSDSCIGQNKNNIVLVYLMLRVARGYHYEIVWQFMAVGHTTFRPDEGFGQIRRHIENHSNILSMHELEGSIDDSSVSNICVLFPTNEVRYRKEVSKVFKPLDGIRKYFAYKMHIKAAYEGGIRKTVVDVYDEPNSREPVRSVSLHRSSRNLPTFESFNLVPVKQLTAGRREGLLKDVYLVLERNRINMTAEAKLWWKSIMEVTE